MTGHRLFTLAALALLAVACNREAISPDMGGDEVIDFTAYFAQGATKAMGEIDHFAAADSIGVFASYTGAVRYDLSSVSPDFMYNQKVTYDGGNWTYSPVKYWPNNSPEYISFFSYYPYISSEKAAKAKDGVIGFSNSYAKGDPWLVFRLPEGAPATQTDLLYGTPVFDVTKQPVSGDGSKVSFRMNHALACLADTVKVKMSQGLYDQVHDSLDITITSLNIVYSNLTTKARLVLNCAGEPNWKEVISGELLTSRSYRNSSISHTFPKTATGPDSTIVDSGKGLFYIPLQIAGQPRPQAEITLGYSINGSDPSVSIKDSVTAVVNFTPGDASYKQNLVLTLTENLCLDADIVTRPGGGVSMSGDLGKIDKEVQIIPDPDSIKFSGAVTTYPIPRTGRYILEAWGAQGGNGKVDGSTVSVGAKGGMATAEFNLSIGDVLYVYVGGKGENGASGTGGAGGWNGGGNGGNPYSSSYGGGGGGGATLIALSDIGPISSTSGTKLSSKMGTIGDLLLVAGGGGGGSWYQYAAGSGGGGDGQPGYGAEQPIPQPFSPWYIDGKYSYGANGGNGGAFSYSAEGNGGGGGGFFGGNAKIFTNDAANQSTGGCGGNSAANTDRYNYAGGYNTHSGEREGDGLVVIKFKESL